jgi:cardiolipin synthase A/B
MKRRQMAWPLSLLALAAALGQAACVGLPPPAQTEPPAPPLPQREAAEQITLQGRGGPVTDAQKAADLARLRAEGRGALVQHHLGVLARDGEAELYRGNAARLLIDGPQTFGAMKVAIAAARHRVLLESYIVEGDGVAAEIAELLLRKAAQGVHVALLYDSVGSIGTDRAFFDRLRAGGVAVCAFNPINPMERIGHWGLVQRNHRKMLAVDSDVAYTGGINLSNVYSEGSFSSGRGRRSGPDAEGWRDTQIELRGPVVGGMAAMFRVSWAAQGCPGVLPPAPPPKTSLPGQRIVKLVAGDPKEGVNPTYTALMAAVQSAKLNVRLTMAYFAPGPDMVNALADAARRGVDVALVLPGRSDATLVLHAGRSYYEQLLAAGVQIYELQGSVMHAKTAVIDGVFSSVGSSNLDWRSIVGNNEIDVIVLGDDFAREMEALFERDVQVSERIDAATWAQRGLPRRLLEGFGRMVEPLL